MKKTLFWPLLAVMFWLPLPEGSKPPWAMGILMMLVYGLALFWLLGYARNRLPVTLAFQKARWIHLGFILVTSWLFIQQLPLPADWVKALSPHAWDIHSQAYLALGLPLPELLPLSIDPFATLMTALLTLAYYLLFCLCLLLIDRPEKLRAFAWVLVVAGVFQAVFGSLSTLSGLEVLLFRDKPSYFGVASGTFVNRNSFAGCLEMTLAAGMGLLIAQLNERASQSWQEWLHRTLKTLMSNKVILRTGLAIMVIGLVLSRSRMGNTAFFSSLMITGLLYVICRKQLSRGMVVLFVSLLVIDTAIVSQWFGLEKVVERIEQTSLERETRPNVSEVTLDAIGDYGLTGTGGGSFYTTLPAYHDGSWKGYYDLAHNDFLQFPLEFGLPVYGILALMVLAAAWHAIVAMRQRRNRLMVGMGFTAFMGILAIMIHSSVDFNLQVPSNSAYFVCMMALGVLARYLPTVGKVRR
ncbi:O-antigen ligase family protein [Endozoicomonas sp. GU-1]|uniref:O-antigen ligase family protein n=1 Tax=Endozoicomonas sp. GU-1 TaxID=3009078 RepID=UPI0022B577E7|nr:O-antigen ligase family protein [Endozoicomonas sp. GU-1]WBA81527.1 O-antigen ligase family protein [Endozoicomonas sp. GU-1]WBA84476.1 O-antigen ligase family protein [Endozoicomonas sp. GU-1]